SLPLSPIATTNYIYCRIGKRRSSFMKKQKKTGHNSPFFEHDGDGAAKEKTRYRYSKDTKKKINLFDLDPVKVDVLQMELHFSLNKDSISSWLLHNLQCMGNKHENSLFVS